jgi:hypothetical protein
MAGLAIREAAGMEINPVTRSNLLYLIIGALVIVVAVMGYQLYGDGLSAVSGPLAAKRHAD